EHPVSEGPGAMIGPYELLEQLGEGGFGVVFLAEQTQPVRRKVALKVLKPGMDTRPVAVRAGRNRPMKLRDKPLRRLRRPPAPPDPAPAMVPLTVPVRPIATVHGSRGTRVQSGIEPQPRPGLGRRMAGGGAATGPEPAPFGARIPAVISARKDAK